MRALWAILPISFVLLLSTGETAVGGQTQDGRAQASFRAGVRTGDAPTEHAVTSSIRQPRTALTTSGAQLVVNFDTGTAPCSFSETAPLREEFAFAGIHFRGPTADQGGAILNECGRFGVGARSGRQFLAFNKFESYAKTPERIIFDDLQTRVSLYMASQERSKYRLVGKRDGLVVSQAVVVGTSGRYTKLSVRSDEGIDRVKFTAQADTFVVDDLELALPPVATSP